MGYMQRLNGHKLTSPLAGHARPALDRFHRTLTVGDLVLFHQESDPVCAVVAVEPDLDPRAPTGALRLRLQAEFVLTVAPQQPVSSLVRIGHAEQPQECEAAAEAAAAETVADAPEIGRTPGIFRRLRTWLGRGETASDAKEQ